MRSHKVFGDLISGDSCATLFSRSRISAGSKLSFLCDAGLPEGRVARERICPGDAIKPPSLKILRQAPLPGRQGCRAAWSPAAARGCEAAGVDVEERRCIKFASLPQGRSRAAQTKPLLRRGWAARARKTLCALRVKSSINIFFLVIFIFRRRRRCEATRGCKYKFTCVHSLEI